MSGEATRDTVFRMAVSNVLFNYVQGEQADRIADYLVDLYQRNYPEDKF